MLHLRRPDGLVETPAHFGAPWDVSISASFDPAELEQIFGVVTSDDRVAAAAGLWGTDAAIGDEVAWVHAFVPVDGIDGLVGPVITSGRAPAAADEIALGGVTMATQGLAVGDTVMVQSTPSATQTPAQMTIVGTTVMNDSGENNPGRGGVVTGDWIDRYAPETSPDPLVVQLVPGADAGQFRGDVRAVTAGFVEPPVLQGAIRNLMRLRWVPFLLATLVGVLAIASLAHAIVLSVRRQRGQLGILKSLGLRRGQVRATVAWRASVFVLVGAVVGVPLGVIAGRWGLALGRRRARRGQPTGDAVAVGAGDRGRGLRRRQRGRGSRAGRLPASRLPKPCAPSDGSLQSCCGRCAVARPVAVAATLLLFRCRRKRHLAH